MENLRPRSRVDKNARRVLGGGDARVMAMAMRGANDVGTDDGEDEAFARALNRDEKHTNLNERALSGPRLPHKHAKETEKGEWADCLVSTRPDVGHFICKECGYDKYATSREYKLRNIKKGTNRVLYCQRQAAWRHSR